MADQPSDRQTREGSKGNYASDKPFVALWSGSLFEAFPIIYITAMLNVIYRVFIKYRIFSKILKYIPDSCLSPFSLDVSVRTLVEHQRWSRTCRVHKIQKNFRNTLLD